MVKRCEMKRAIVNFVQFVRYLADRASIKLTQFAMKNVSPDRLFACGIIFMFADRGGGGRKRTEALVIPASALTQRPTLCISSRGHIRC